MFSGFERLARTSLKWLRRLLILGLVFLLLAYLLVLSPLGQYVLKRQAAAVLGGVFGVPVEIGTVRTDFWSKLDVYGVVARDSVDVLSLGHIRVRYFLPALLRRTVLLKRVRLEKIYATVVRHRDGRVGFFYRPARPKSQSPEPEAGSGWKVQVREIEFRDLDGQYVDVGLELRAQMLGARGRVRFVRGDSLLVELMTGRASLKSPWWVGELEKIEAKGGLGRYGLQLDAARLRGEGAEVTGSGFIPFRRKGVWNLAANVKGKFEPIVVLRRVLPQLGPTGSFEGEVSWYGPLKLPHLYADLKLRDLRLFSRRVRQAAVLARYDRGHRLRGSVVLQTLFGKVEVRADARVRRLLGSPRLGAYEVQVTADSVALDSLLRDASLRWPLRGGWLTSELWARGRRSLLPRELIWKLQAEGLSAADTSLPDLWVETELDSNAWKTRLFWGANAVQASGILDPRLNLRGIVNADLSELSVPFLAFLGRRAVGWIAAGLEVFGRPKNLGFQGEVRARDLVLARSRVDTLWASLRGSTRSLRVESSFFRASGDLTGLAAELGLRGLRGRVRVEGRASGPPGHLQVRGSVSCTDLGYGGFRADSLVGQFQFFGDSLRWSDVRLWRDTLRLSTYGFLSLTPGGTRAAADFYPGSHQGHLRVGFQRVEDSMSVSAGWEGLQLAAVLPWIPGVPLLSGQGDGLFELSGKRARTRAKLRARVDEARYRDLGPVWLQAQAALDSGRLTFSGVGTLRPDGKPIEWVGTLWVDSGRPWVPLATRDRPAQVEIRAESLGLAPISDWFAGRFRLGGRCTLWTALQDTGSGWEQTGTSWLEGVEFAWPERNLRVGNLRGRVRVAGALREPRASVDLRTGTISFRGEKLDSSFWRGQADLRRFALTEARVWAKSGELQLAGAFPLRNPAGEGIGSRDSLRVDFRAFPLDPANVFLPRFRIEEGRVDGWLLARWRGPWPGLWGELDFGPARLTFGNLRPDLRLLDASLRFREDSIFVDRVVGTWGGGTFSAVGSLGVNESGLSHADLRTTARDLHFAVPEVLDVRVQQAALGFVSGEGGSRLRGDVVLGETRFLRNLGFADLVKSIRGVTEPPSRPSEFLKRLELDVAVRAPERFVVDMNLAKLLLDAEIAISGRAASPRFTGVVQVVEGYILYLDRKFEVTRGVFRQFEPFRLNPEIDFEAVAEVIPYSPVEAPTAYRVTLRLTGDLDHPVLALESDPPLSQTDIVSLLTLGRVRAPTDELASPGEPSLGQILVERARAITSQQVTGLAERRIERLLNLESVTIDGNLFQLNQSWAPRVTITKRLAERLNLSYQTVVGHTNEQRIKISYRLNPFLYLDGETDELGQAGIDLRVRLRFK